MNNNRGMKAFFILLGLLLMSFSTGIFGQAVSDEARRHFDRGMAAVEMAKSPDDYAPAIMEFKQAVSLAPNWPDAYYNLGKAQEKAGQYSDAITSLRQFLVVAPNANEAEAVKTLINKLEYKNEQEEKYQNVYNIMTSDPSARKQIERKVLSGEFGERGLVP
jgi:tetratricopeptide (TPR) repeat protein